jgi:DNA-binding GntR family transcriptional regulator
MRSRLTTIGSEFSLHGEADVAGAHLEAALQERATIESNLRLIYQNIHGQESSADAAHHTLHEAITTGMLPPGWLLREENLAGVFQVSRTPIREALMRLEREHLVEHFRRRGLVVSEVTTEQVLEVYIIREALDGIAARLAAQFATEADIIEMGEINHLIQLAYEGGDYQQMARLNVDFHDVIARASRNEMLHEFVQNVHTWVMRFQTTTFSHVGRAPQAIEEHEEIILGIRRRDALAAEDAARRHIRRSLDARLAMGPKARG